MAEVRRLVDCTNTLGEGPVWDVAEQRLYWIDSMAKEIWRCTVDGGDVRTWPLPSEVGSLALREGGGAVLALRTGICFFDFDTGAIEQVADPTAGLRKLRLNDGKVDRRGRFIVGGLDLEVYEKGAGAARGALFRLDPDRGIHQLESGIACTNGPCWSADDRTFYFTDSALDTIYAYDYDLEQGAIANRRTFARLERLIPDGATVDAEGYYWATMNGAFSGIGELRRFAPDGTLALTVPLPVRKPTSLMFGGPDLDIIYVTSMRLDGDFPIEEGDGAVYAVHGLGIRGLPEPRFAG